MELDTNALVLGFRAFRRGWEEEARQQIRRAIRKDRKEESKFSSTIDMRHQKKSCQ